MYVKDSKHTVSHRYGPPVVFCCRSIPYVGELIESPFEDFLEAQKKKYLTPAGEHVTMVIILLSVL